MNERINELRSQVKLTLPDPADNPTYYKNHVEPLAKIFTQGDNAVLNEYMEKFAELMVKKFDDILVLEYLDCIGNRDKKAEERIERLREKVKTYFGVEE